MPVAPVTTIVLVIQCLDLAFGHALDNWFIALLGQMLLALKIDHVTVLGSLGFKIKTVMLIAGEKCAGCVC